MQVVGETVKEVGSIEKFTGLTSIRWPIQGLFNRLDVTISSDPFVLHASTAEFHLESSFDSDFFVTLRLDEIGVKEALVSFKWRCWLENQDGDKLMEGQFFPKKFKNVGDTDEIAVAKKDELLKMSDFFKNSVVIVCCDLKRKLNEKSAFNESMEFTQERKINLVLRPKLNDSMESSPKPTAIVTTEFNSNCLFEVEGQKINVPKSFLNENSKIFENLFLEYKLSSTIKIEGISVDVFKGMLQFLDVSSISNLNKVDKDLFVVAEKCKADELKVVCADSIAQRLAADTLFETLKLAYIHNCDQLKHHISDFLSQNATQRYFTKMLITSEWFHFSATNERLAKTIIEDMFEKTGTTI